MNSKHTSAKACSFWVIEIIKITTVRKSLCIQKIANKIYNSDKNIYLENNKNIIIN